MDILLNYIVIGFAFAFIVDYMLNLKVFKNHPQTQNAKWGWGEMVCAVIAWPIGIIIFVYTFIQQYFKK